MSNNAAESGSAGRGPLRIVALFALIVGAIGSLGFMFSVGRHQKSVILIGLFTGWVLAPFVLLAIANRRSARWTVRTQTMLHGSMLHGSMLILTLSSLAIYGRVALGPPRPQPSFAFLMVPAVSLVMMTIVAVVARMLGAKR